MSNETNKAEGVEEILQKALDYLHENISASIIYEDFYDFSKGIKGAEVDYFPETSQELLSEMGCAHWQRNDPAFTAEIVEKTLAYVAEHGKMFMNVAEVEPEIKLIKVVKNLFFNGNNAIRIDTDGIKAMHPDIVNQIFKEKV